MFSIDVDGIGKKLAGFGVGAGIFAIGKASIQLAADAEQASVAFEVLTGSAEKASKLIADMRRLDQSSPLAFTDFQQASKTMIAFGVDTDQVKKRLAQLSAISMGSAERFQSLALAFSQTSASGRLMGQEVLQFVNAGFNPLMQISQMTGESMVELKKRLEAGGISVEEVGRAFDAATEKGGLFYGMNEKIAQTTAGQLAKLQGDFKMLGMEIGNGLVPVLKQSVELIRQFTAEPGIIRDIAIAAGDGSEYVFAALRMALSGGDMTGMDALTERIAERDAKLKAESYLYKPSKADQEKIDKRMKALEEEAAQKKRIQQITDEAIEADNQRFELSEQRIEELRKEVELQKAKNAGIHDEIALRAKSLGYNEKAVEKMIALEKELQELKDEPKQKARAEALIAETDPFKKLVDGLEEAAKLFSDGFLNKAQFDAILGKAAEEESKKDSPQRRETPTVMAGSVEAYKLLLEKDRNRDREIEIANAQKNLLASIDRELRNRGVLGVVKK
jgi:tape measure domain-containing protein